MQKTSQRWIFGLVGLIGVLVVVCCGVAGVGGFRLFQAAQTEIDGTLAVIDQFMQAGAQADMATAAALFTPAAEVGPAELARLFDERADAFAAYGSVSQRSFQIRSYNNETTATLSGEIHYSDDRPTRQFSATLRKIAGVWQLERFQFNDGVGI